MGWPSHPLESPVVPCLVLGLTFLSLLRAAEVHTITDGTNRYEIRKAGKILAINGASEKAARLLLTHNRRYIVEAARAAAGPDTKIYAPAASRELLEGAEAHWQNWWLKRFDYYGQQVTKIPTKNFPAQHYLEDGQEFEWQGLSIRFISLPGYTKDGGGYVVTSDSGNKIIFTGELILAGGRTPDLYSFQNEIREAKIGNYHGYLGRLSNWLDSVEKLRKEKPSLIYPARGAVIENPEETLSSAANRARQIYKNYLSTNALHWYFGEERMGNAARIVLGENHGVTGMPLAEHVDLPEWCHHIGTTKLLISKNKRGFVLDVGGRKQFESLFKYQASGIVEGYDGIFVTHTHNDHSAYVMDAEKELGCPVYATEEVAGVLLNPGNYHLPGIPNKPVRSVRIMKDGEKMKWEEYTFTFRFFPGQMYHHGALLVERDDHLPVFFIGDSFSPSGVDDYCVMNRNLMRPGTGYYRCFDIVEKLPEGAWLVNQHINHLFRFTEKELRFLRSNYVKRRNLIAEFVQWDEPNYGIDEQWSWFYPYGQQASAGDTVSVSIRLWNHSAVERTFAVTLHGNEYLRPAEGNVEIRLAAGQRGEAKFDVDIAKKAPEQTHVYTASISGQSKEPHYYWIEGLIHTGK